MADQVRTVRRLSEVTTPKKVIVEKRYVGSFIAPDMVAETAKMTEAEMQRRAADEKKRAEQDKARMQQEEQARLKAKIAEALMFSPPPSAPTSLPLRSPASSTPMPRSNSRSEMLGNQENMMCPPSPVNQKQRRPASSLVDAHDRNFEESLDYMCTVLNAEPRNVLRKYLLENNYDCHEAITAVLSDKLGK